MSWISNFSSSFKIVVMALVIKSKERKAKTWEGRMARLKAGATPTLTLLALEGQRESWRGIKLSPKVALCCLARHSHNLHSRPWQALPQAGRAEPTPCAVLICKCVYITAQRVHNSWETNPGLDLMAPKTQPGYLQIEREEKRCPRNV